MEKVYIAQQDIPLLGVKQGEVFELSVDKAKFYLVMGLIKEQDTGFKNMKRK